MGSSKRFVQSVLLVDGAEMMLRAWSRECRRFGKIPFTASTRTEAVQVAARERPEMAVVDLLMPNESGLQIVRELKSLSIDIFVILASGAMCVDYAMLGIEAGADDCCDKTVTIGQLIHRVECGKRPDPLLDRIPSLDEVQWEHIARVLNDCNGNISHAAEALGEYRYSLQRKIKKLAPGALRAKPRTRRSSRHARRDDDDE